MRIARRRWPNAALRALLENAADFTEFARALGMPGHEKLPEKPADIAKLVKRFDKLSPAKRKEENGWLRLRHLQQGDPQAAHRGAGGFPHQLRGRFRQPQLGRGGRHRRTSRTGSGEGHESKVTAAFHRHPHIKPFTEDLKERGARTLDIFLTTLAQVHQRKTAPDNFVVMLPKVTIPEQITALVQLEAMKPTPSSRRVH
ncbi:MAG: hypothetical protein R2815_08860 [Flavobacteriales bacterium]